MYKTKLNKRNSLNLGGALCLILAVYLICYLLMQDNFFPTSISSMLACLNTCAHHHPVLAVGLLPIYVALMVFGTAILGIYFGSFVHRVISHFLKK